MNQQSERVGTCKKTSNLRRREKTFKPHKYVCEQCSWSFKRRADLTKHLIVHSDLKPFKCHICSKSFKRASDAKDHLIVHSDARPYGCSMCSKRFKRLPSLKVHENSAHSKKREKARSRKKRSLALSVQPDKAHASTLNLHNDLSVCTSRKQKPSKLKSCHRRKSSERSKNDKYSYIGEVEDALKLLYCHDENQNIVFDTTNHKLKHCDKSYASRKFTKLRLGSSETFCKTVSQGMSESVENTELYKCNRCRLSFKQFRLLKTHLHHSHTGHKHYACGHCNRRFKRSRRLKEHVKSISGTEQQTFGKLCDRENGLRVKLIQTYNSERDISSNQTKSGKENNDYKKGDNFIFKMDSFDTDHRIDKTPLKKGSLNLRSTTHQMGLEQENSKDHGHQENDILPNKDDMNVTVENNDMYLWNFLNEITMFGRKDWQALIDETIGEGNINEFLKLDLFPDSDPIFE